MMNNNYTYDKVAAIIKKINEIRGILKELDNEDSTFLTESFDCCNEYLDNLEDEILPYCQSPMPKLKNGMYGVIEIEDFNEGIDTDTFIVYGGKIVTLGGRVFDATNFNDSYYHEDFHYMYRITTIYDGGAPIDNVADFSKQIWKYND